MVNQRNQRWKELGKAIDLASGHAIETIVDVIADSAGWQNHDVADVQRPQEHTAPTTCSTPDVVDTRTRTRHRFSYLDEPCSKCTEVVISERAFASILAEALSRDPLETGGILLGVIDHGVWYVVEASDPGIQTTHTTVHHEMDQRYHNHVYPVLARLYETELALVGLWHRHPGDLNRFSAEDNHTNTKYAEAIGRGTLSFLLNFGRDGQAQLTCYYLDDKGTGCYHKPVVRIGDRNFQGTNYLTIASADTLMNRKQQMQIDIRSAG